MRTNIIFTRKKQSFAEYGNLQTARKKGVGRGCDLPASPSCEFVKK